MRFPFWRRVALLFILPVVLSFLMLLIMLLPIDVRNQLVLTPGNPSWWQILTSAFVHRDIISHYLSNIVVFVILSFLELIIVVLINKEKTFYLLLVFVMIFFPIFNSTITVLGYHFGIWYFPHVLTSEGFSGIDAAMIGFIPVLILSYFMKRFREENIDFTFLDRVNYILSFFALQMLAIMLVYNSNPVLMLLPDILIILLVALILIRIRNPKAVGASIIKALKTNTKFYVYIVILLVTFVVSIELLYPPITPGDTRPDIVAHTLGFVVGVVSSYIAFIGRD